MSILLSAVVPVTHELMCASINRGFKMEFLKPLNQKTVGEMQFHCECWWHLRVLLLLKCGFYVNKRALQNWTWRGFVIFFFKISFLFLSVHACVCLWGGFVYVVQYPRRPGEGPVPPELELQVVVNWPMWVLGTELTASAIPVSAELKVLNSSTGFSPGISVSWVDRSMDSRALQAECRER